MPEKPVLHLGQPSWRLQLGDVETWVTQLGGHLAPAHFRLDKKIVSPLHVSPWHSEKMGPEIPPVLRVLRGDFFCLPFGMNETALHGEKHPAHGESANARWKLAGIESRDEMLSAQFSLKLNVRPGQLRKIVQLRRGQSVIYQRHIITGMKGPMNYGHHATLRFGSEGRLSFSPFQWGQVYPGQFENPATGGYPCLRPGATFQYLEKVPRMDGTVTDLTRYPNREGHEDVAMICAKSGLPFAWSAVVFPKEGWVWFALKDPRVLPSTLLWHSNGGRHFPPWNGRHRAVLGVEEICSYFQEGFPASVRPNSISRRGIPTCHVFSPETPFAINYIMGVAAVSPSFNRVAKIEAVREGIRLTAQSGARTETAIDLGFLTEAIQPFEKRQPLFSSNERPGPG